MNWAVSAIILSALLLACGPDKGGSDDSGTGTGGASSSTGAPSTGESAGSSTGGPATTGGPPCQCNNDCGNGCTPEPVCGGGEVICDCGNCNESMSDTGSATSTTSTTIPPEPTTVEPDTTTGGAVDCSSDPPSFPEFDRGCVVDVDCAVVLHQIDCCGTFVAWGLRADVAKTFAEAEALCESQYPLCGCAAQPTVADDGMASNNNDFAVTCKDGSCFSFVP